MPEIRAPATIVDLAELCGATSRLEWAVAREMHAGGDTWTLWHDGALLGMFGIYPVDAARTLGECWFNILPQAAPHMLFLVRQIRLTLMAGSYPAYVTVVYTAAGARIASACGFSLREKREFGDLYEQSVRK